MNVVAVCFDNLLNSVALRMVSSVEFLSLWMLKGKIHLKKNR